MAKGIDIFRVYQDVRDWQAVRDSVEFVWIKATNGDHVARFNDGSPAPADPTVAGASSVGLPCGLYHYAMNGDPVAQADVFADEVLRLGCHGPGFLPPALDVEEPGTVTADFATRFLTHLRDRIGQDRVAIYTSAGAMADLQPADWGISGLIIWTAAYGPNDGARHPIADWSKYRGRTDVHQYTSVGFCPGINSSGLDENESDIPLTQLLGTDQEDFMSELQPWEQRRLFERVLSMSAGVEGQNYDGDQFAWEKSQLLGLAAKLDGLAAAVSALSANKNLTVDAVKAIVDEAVAKHFQVAGSAPGGTTPPAAAGAGSQTTSAPPGA